MPDRIFGIYGFNFTHRIVVGDVELLPLYARAESELKARDRKVFHLTGYGRFLAPSAAAMSDVNTARLLVDGMTFVEQQQVVAGLLINMSPGDTVDTFVASPRFARSIPSVTERHAFGNLIIEDAWSRDSRATFLRAFLNRFAVEQANDSLRLAFYRQIEISRLATPFVELHHFLAFSALELLARSRGANAGNTNVAVPIKDLLNDLGFAIQQTEVEEWARSRNAAFHRGQLIIPNPNGGTPIKLSDHLLTINNVLADILLRLLPFDDGHINWHRWRDRQPFI